MVIRDKRAKLRGDGGAIETHHKELAHLPASASVGASDGNAEVVANGSRERSTYLSRSSHTGGSASSSCRAMMALQNGVKRRKQD